MSGKKKENVSSVDKFLKKTSLVSFKDQGGKKGSLTPPTVTSIQEIAGETYDVHGAAKFFGVHYLTIYKWIDKNLLECDYDLTTDGRRYNITFTPQQLANRIYKKKHA